jgi:hypothetical protein
MRLADPSLQARRDALIARVHDATRSVLGTFGRKEPAGGEVFAERLLALRHVQMLGPHVREVRVAPGTVITPLARDELKRRGVAVRWVSRRDVDAVRDRGEWAFAIEGESGVLTALRRTWLEERESWRELPALADAARWVAEAPGRGAVVVSDDAAVAVWRANRVAGVRAAGAETGSSVARAVAGLGLNLLVIEPAGKPLPLIRQLATTFRSAGAPAVPAHLLEEAAPCVSPK